MRKLGCVRSCFALALVALTVNAFAGTPKAIMFMLDGCRADAIEAVNMPNVDKLRFGKWQPGYRGCWTVTGQTVPDAAPNSAPNHVALATGVKGSKNGVTANGQTASGNYATYPTWLKRVADTGKSATFAYTWSEDGDLGQAANVTFLGGTDAGNGAALATTLAGADCPDAIMYFIDGPDHGGHNSGFYPLSTGYRSELATADNLIGACLDAIASRATFADEDWMVIICADHGGYAKTHGQQDGASKDGFDEGCRQAHTIPMVIASPSVPQGRIPGCPVIYDLPVTALAHFGISPSGLDGAVLGATVAPDVPRALTDGLKVYMPFDDAAKTNNLAPGSAIVPEAFGTTAIVTNGFTRSYLKISSGGYVKLTGTKTSELAYEGNGKSLTICCWARIGAQDGDPVLFGNGNWNNGWRTGILMVAAGNAAGGDTKGVLLNMGSGSSGGGRTRYGSFDWEATDRWTFYAITRTDEGVISVYQGRSDGTLDWIAGTLSFFRIDSADPFCIGQDGTGAYGKKFVGDVDDFALWTRGLTHQEIKRIYEAGRAGVDLGDLIKHDTDAPEMSVASYDGTTATLAFGGVRTRTYSLCVASGTADAAGDKHAWTDFVKVADIAAGATSYNYTVPAEYISESRWFRFFLMQDTDLPYAGETEYLQSDGNSYIDSDVAPRRDLVTTFDLVFTGQQGSWDWIFGSRGSVDKKSNYALARKNGNTWHWEITGSNATTGSPANNTPFHVIFAAERFEANGAFVNTGASIANFIEHGYPMRVFANQYMGTDYDQRLIGKISSFKFATGKYTARDYVPVKDANGKGGFFDRVSGQFFGSATATDFTCGPDRAAVRSGWERAMSESLSADGNKPITATWIGGGVAGDATDAANWRCLNAQGDVIDGALPTADTDVTIAGPTTFGVASGATLAAKSITYTDVRLTADVDWRGLAAAQLSGYETIDLGGHQLTIRADQLGGVTYTDTSTGTPGELHVVVASGEFTNNFSTLAGNLKLVKEGAGTFIPSKTQQTYTGGTVIAEGIVKANKAGTNYQFGQWGAMVQIESGAVFDNNGFDAFTAVRFVVNGGTLRNTGADKDETTVLGKTELTADSYITPTGTMSMWWDGHYLDFGGHTLTATIGAGKFLSIGGNSTVFRGGGKLDIVSGGWFKVFHGTLNASNTDFRVNCALNLKAALMVHDYDAVYDGICSEGTAKMSVYGTFTPRSGMFYGCELQDGSTIDLSAKDATWSVTRTVVNASANGNGTVTFAKDATITVDLHGRTFAVGEQVISWSVLPDNVTFQMDTETAAANPGIELKQSALGLYFGADPADNTPVTAVWVGNGNRANLSDPQNWVCRNLAGVVIEGAIPAVNVTQVFITDATSFNFAVGATPIWYSLRFTGAIALTADADWRGLAAFDASDAVIDLKGHQLYLDSAQVTMLGASAITDSGDGSAAAYSQYRFRVSKIKADTITECCQISELKLFAGDVNYALADNRASLTASAGMTGGSANEKFEKIADGNVGTKWCQTNVVAAADCYLTFTYEQPVSLSDYEWWSANDTGTHTGRSPVSWTLQGSNDGSNWVDLDVQTDNLDARRTDYARAYRRAFVAPGEVHLAVAENETFTLNALALNGNLKFVKEGAGTLVMSKIQGYRAGTHITAGTVKFGITASSGNGSQPCGVGEIEVDAGAALDAWSRYSDLYRIVLNGGRFLNTRNPACGNANIAVSDIFLTADSEMPFDPQTAASEDVYVLPGSVWNFHGHTLTIRFDGNDPDFCACQYGNGNNKSKLILIDGTVRTVGGVEKCYWQDRGGVDGSQGGSLELNNVIRVHGNATVSNLTIHATTDNVYSGNNNEFSISVYGTFKLIGGLCPMVRMLDGSTIDLRAETGAWASDGFPTTSSGGAKKIIYADNATVTIDLRGRTLATGEKVVGWTTQPTNIATLKFVANRGWEKPVKLKVKEDGIYYYPTGIALIIR